MKKFILTEDEKHLLNVDQISEFFLYTDSDHHVMVKARIGASDTIMILSYAKPINSESNSERAVKVLNSIISFIEEDNSFSILRL